MATSPTPDSPSSARRDWLRDFLPAPVHVDARERIRVVCGAAAGVLATALLCHLAGGANAVWLAPSMGASALLVFGVPSSPLAQPWPVVAGNTLSALVGIGVARAAMPVEAAAALAVGGAIAVMFSLRCLHPPGAATALMVVLSGTTSPRFALFPVLVNALLLAAVGIAYNSATRRRYPHRQVAPAAGAAQAANDADLDAALARYNQVLDISRDDLRALLEETRLASYQRQLAQTRCGEIMSRELATADYGTPLEDAWALLRRRGIKALPVVDTRSRVIGIVTVADFMRSAELDLHEGFDAKLRKLIRRTRTTHTSKPEAVGQIMTTAPLVVGAERPLVDLVELFARSRHHHVPVVDNDRRLVGMVTQSDLVEALFRSVQPAAARA